MRLRGRIFRIIPKKPQDWRNLLLALTIILGGYSFDSHQIKVDQVGLPRRLVIGLDGLAYADVKLAQEQGLFRNFHPVSRLISTYPSLSDSAWAEIFGTVRPNNFQRYYFHEKANKSVGNAFSDLTNPIEYEKRMHVTFNSMVHHLISYINSYESAVQELAEISDRFLHTQGVEQFFAYSVSTDSFQHAAGGDVMDYLRLLDTELNRLSAIYKRSNGEPLEIVLLSDHGHNHARGARPFPLPKKLKEIGFRESLTLKDKQDVVLAQNGTLTALVLFSHPEKRQNLAEGLAQMEGVDVVTYMDTQEPGTIRLISDQGHSQAQIRAHDQERKYQFQILQGDPLGYTAVLKKIQAREKVSARSYLHESIWLKYTAEENYPMAADRIWRGHYVNTLQHPHVLVSLKDGYEFAVGLTGMLTTVNLNDWGGSHGSLNANCSLGIVMSNFKPTKDMATRDVQNHFGGFYPFLHDYRLLSPGVRLIDEKTADDLLRGRPLIGQLDLSGKESAVYLSFWDPETRKNWVQGISTEFRFVLETQVGRGALVNMQKLREFSIDAELMIRTREGLEFFLPMQELFSERSPQMPALQPVSQQAYRVKIFAKRIELPSRAVITQYPIAEQEFGFNPQLQLIYE